MNVWNGGGQGIGNNNYSDAFGKVEVFGNDSVKLSVIDTIGVIIASITIYDGSLPAPTGISEIRHKPAINLAFSAFPNPATSYLILKMEPNKMFGKRAMFNIYDYAGKLILSEPLTIKQENKIDLQKLSSGFFYCILKTDSEMYARKIIKL